jgi:hypothetical protein
VGAGESVKNPNPDKPERPDGRAGKVTHDARGHAVWQWAAETARSVAITTSQVLRRLDTRSLSLLDDTRSGKAPAKSQATKPQATQSQPTKSQATKSQGPVKGFDPYEGRASKPAFKPAANPTKVAARNPAPGIKPVRSSWWQRMLRRG